MQPRSTSNLFKAGLFVCGGILLTASAAVLLSGVAKRLTPGTPHEVAFTLTQGAFGLEEGSRVLLGGRPVGLVTGVAFDTDASGTPSGVRVGIKVSPKVPLFADATILLQRPLLGSGAWLNITSVGGAALQLSDGGTLSGQIAGPEFLAQAGFGPKQARQLRAVIEHAEAITGDLEVLTAGVRARASLALENADSAVEDIRAVTRDVRVLTTDARSRAAAWFNTADSLAVGAAETLESAKGAADDFRAMLTESRPRFTAVLEDAQRLSARGTALLRAAEGVVESGVPPLLASAKASLKTAEQAVSRADSLLAEQSPAVQTTLANLRLASAQMRLTVAEIRRTPWRLLVRPSERELEFELLYDAARSYAAAVSDLRGAAESLEAVSGSSGSRLSTGGRGVQAYAADVRGAYDEYRAAEDRFLEMLKANAPH